MAGFLALEEIEGLADELEYPETEVDGQALGAFQGILSRYLGRVSFLIPEKEKGALLSA